MTAASGRAARALASSLAVVVCAAAAAATPDAGPNAALAAVDSARLLAAERNAEWLTHGRTYSEQRFSPLQQINAGNVQQLGLAWYAQFDTDRGMEATPLMVDGVLFTTTSWSKVHALDARTGAVKWSYDPKVDGQKAMDACCDVVNRGVALWKGRVYLGALDGRLIALDAGTGKEVWSQQTTDTRWPYTITGAPRVVKDKVIIGNGGAELGVRGYVSAYDATTGKLAWRFYTTPNPQGLPDNAASDRILAQRAASTWSGEGWKRTGGGGTAWDAIVYDPVTDLVYVGVGNGSPWSHQARSDGKGDNLFLSSIVALHADTGEYAWHYQTTPGDSWDYTAVQPIMTADLSIGGARRHVVMQAPKNGFFYVLDAATGKLISAEKFVPVNWAERVDITTGRPVENPAARYPDGKRVIVHSGPAGAHSWHPMSFDPGAGLVFIPAMVSGFPYQNDPGWNFVRGRWNVAQGAGLGSPAIAPSGDASPVRLANPATANLSSAAGQLIAWDPVAQKARWRQTQDASFGGTLATAGGLVFAAAGRDLNAYASADGTRLWSQRAAAPIIAAPMTYALDGEQYIAVSVGYGGVPGVANGSEPRRPGRLQVYKLDGTASAPEFEPFVPRPRIDLAAATPSSGNAARGAQHYATLCATCHTSGIFFPNLLTSPYLLAPVSFRSVVQDGALRANGMANFSAFLNARDVEDVRAYLLAEASKPVLAAADATTGRLWERRNVAHGRVHVEQHRSKLLPVAQREVYVYTPPGYDAHGNRRYPVLYLLHGRGGVAADWTVAGLVNDIADNLLADGKAVPMIIVMPWGHAIPEDAPRPSDPARSNNELFERYLLQEVMPLVEGRYRIAADRRQRALVGLSMGGGQSAQIGYRHTDLFASVGVFSAALPDDLTTRYPFLADAAAANASMALLFYGTGIEDERPHQVLRKLSADLDARGVKNTYFATAGGHDWPVWRECAAQLLPLLFRKQQDASTAGRNKPGLTPAAGVPREAGVRARLPADDESSSRSPAPPASAR